MDFGLTCSHRVSVLTVWSACVRCWSYLGVRGGRQTLSLQSPHCMRTGVTSHELMHSMGFVHEQSRVDRDKYVTIMWPNIYRGKGTRARRGNGVPNIRLVKPFEIVPVIKGYTNKIELNCDPLHLDPWDGQQPLLGAKDWIRAKVIDTMSREVEGEERGRHGCRYVIRV